MLWLFKGFKEKLRSSNSRRRVFDGIIVSLVSLSVNSLPFFSFLWMFSKKPSSRILSKFTWDSILVCSALLPKIWLSFFDAVGRSLRARRPMFLGLNVIFSFSARGKVKGLCNARDNYLKRAYQMASAGVFRLRLDQDHVHLADSCVVCWKRKEIAGCGQKTCRHYSFLSGFNIEELVRKYLDLSNGLFL